MPDTRISKIQVRRGSIADLPLLDAGEFGYATDEQRLFIGNESLTIGSGDGSNTVFTMPSTSLYPADLEAPVSYINPKVYLDGVLSNTVTLNASISNSLNYRIGTDAGNTQEPFAGNLYNMKVYNRDLSINEILQNYNIQKLKFGL